MYSGGVTCCERASDVIHTDRARARSQSRRRVREASVARECPFHLLFPTDAQLPRNNVLGEGQRPDNEVQNATQGQGVELRKLGEDMKIWPELKLPHKSAIQLLAIVRRSQRIGLADKHEACELP